ncbi:MAG: hypothetical protein GY869_09890 [Planctomycetes bacterium]|nr:hypothetical protein [Planctomycetota bacterium]
MAFICSGCSKSWPTNYCPECAATIEQAGGIDTNDSIESSGGEPVVALKDDNVGDLPEWVSEQSETSEDTDDSDSSGEMVERPSWEILILGMVLPGIYMRVTKISREGVAHFYTAFIFYCLLPVVLLNLFAGLTEELWPDFWYFQDINPWTMVIAVPAQLIVGVMNIWIITRCFYAGMKAVGMNPMEKLDRVLTTGWYVGTTMYCLGFWWIGIGVFFLSIDSIGNLFEPVVTGGLVVWIAIWIRIAMSAYRVNVPGRNGGFVKTFFGLVIGAILFIIAMIPIGFALQVIMGAIIGMFL